MHFLRLSLLILSLKTQVYLHAPEVNQVKF